MSTPQHEHTPPINNVGHSTDHQEMITALAMDNNDHVQSAYPIEKLEAHIRDIPHLAISIFVFHNDHLLLQQRASSKYHSGGLWANTVCSHPRWQESVADCADRRLVEELGWHIPLEEIGEIDYRAQVGKLFENEHVHCFRGDFDPSLDTSLFSRDEVAQIKWVHVDNIDSEIAEHPEHYSEWFKIYMQEHKDMIQSH